MCTSKRALTASDPINTTLKEGVATEFSWGMNASSLTLTTAATLKKAGMVTFTSGAQATIVWDGDAKASAVATAVTAATALAASMLF